MAARARIAVVGGGPRGLWAVEELARVAAELPFSFEVFVFDPQPLGRGAAYRLDQPAYHLLNVEAHRVYTGMGQLNDFRRQVLGETDPLPLFPPRATVGLFFHASWEHALAHLPAGCTVRHVEQRISTLQQLEGFDFVLSTSGHEPFPHQEGMLDAYSDFSSIAPGQTVGLQGAALSCIDTVLALTAGRGGSFENSTYHPSGFEPARLLPFSRSGRFIQIKPPQPTDAELEILDSYRPRIGQVASGAQLRALVIEAASELQGTPLVWKDALSTLPPEQLMRVSLLDQRLPAQSFGMAWKNLYPQIIARVSFGQLALDQNLRATLATLKPLTFGTPSAQIERMLALVDAGILDLFMMSRGAEIKADHFITTVQAPAGLAPGSFNEALALAAGADTTEGFLRTDERGFLGTSHRYAAIGRVTEPYVLGNDTISRYNHSIIPAWADAVGQLSLRL